MFLRSYIEERGIQFHPSKNATDVFFVISALCLADRVTVVNKPLICYRKSKEGGLVATISDGLKGAVNEWLMVASFLREQDAFPERSFANRCLESILYLLNNTGSWQAFRESYLFLQNDNLGKLGIICSANEGYYYIKYHNEAVKNLYHMTPEEFCKYIGREFFLKESVAVARSRKNKEDFDSKIKKQKKEIEKQEKEIEKQKKEIEKQRNEIENNNHTIQQLVCENEEQTLLSEKKDNEIKELNLELDRKIEEIKNITDELNVLKQVVEEKNKGIASLKKTVNLKNSEIKAIKESVSYKIGRKITWIPRNIRGVKKHGGS